MVIQEVRWSPAAQLVLGAGLAFYLAVMGVVLGGGKGSPAIAVAVIAIILVELWVLLIFRKLRVTVEGMELRVGFGPFRRRIPLHEIDRVAPVKYRWFEWGGWGIRLKRGAVMYNVPGDKGRAVELSLKNGKRVLFSAGDPDAVSLAIRQQRALAP